MNLTPAEPKDLRHGQVYLLHWPTLPGQLVPARLVRMSQNVLRPADGPQELLLEFRALQPELESRNPFRSQMRDEHFSNPEVPKRIFLLDVPE